MLLKIYPELSHELLAISKSWKILITSQNLCSVCSANIASCQLL